MRVRGSWWPNKDCKILTPTLMAISVVSFSFSWCSTRGPGAQLSAEWWLSLLHLITNWSCPQTPPGVPWAPLAGCGFPYHILSLTRLISNSLGGPEGPFRRVVAFSITSCLRLLWSPTHWLPALTKLYNSSIAYSIFGMECLIVIKRK